MPEAKQAASHRRALHAGWVVAAALLPAAQAQEVPLPVAPPLVQATGWRITPRVSFTETYSTNVALVADELAREGWLTTLTPGITIERVTPKSQVFFNYRLHNIYYSDDILPNERQNFLDADARIQLVDNFLFLDARASITQEQISPFAGAIVPDQATASRNRTETQFYQVAPNIRGFLGGNAIYQARVSETLTDSEDPTLARTRSTQVSGAVRNASSRAALGWSVDGNAQRVRNDVNGVIEDGRVRATAYFAVIPTLRLSLSEGYESTDFAGPPRVKGDTPGVGVDWLPSPRTQFSGTWEKRYFGDGHNIFFSHRTPLTAWRFTSSRDVTILPNQLASANLRSVSGLLTDLLASAVPDPLERREAVRRRMEESFLPEVSAVGTGLLTPTPLLLELLEGLVVYTGRVDTLTFRIARREERSFGTLETVASPLSTDVRREGLNLTWAHRMSPLMTLTMNATAVRTTSLIDSQLETKDSAVDLICSGRLSPKSTLSLGVRHVRVQSTAVASYRENAVFATFTTRL